MSIPARERRNRWRVVRDVVRGMAFRVLFGVLALIAFMVCIL